MQGRPVAQEKKAAAAVPEMVGRLEFRQNPGEGQEPVEVAVVVPVEVVLLAERQPEAGESVPGRVEAPRGELPVLPLA